MNRVVFFLVIFVLVAVPVHAETVVRGRVLDNNMSFQTFCTNNC